MKKIFMNNVKQIGSADSVSLWNLTSRFLVDRTNVTACLALLFNIHFDNWVMFHCIDAHGGIICEIEF